MSLSFQASCSIVSSNAQASPTRGVRVSAPTRSPQPSGTTRGRWTVVRTLLDPVCGGIRVRGSSIENITVGPLPGRSSKGTASSRGGGRRAAGDIRVLAHAVLPQEPGAPARAVVELGPLIGRLAGVEGDVGAEARVALVQKRPQLARDFGGLRLERREPGETIPVEEFDRGQIGEMAIDRLLDIDLAAAGLLLGIGLDTAQVGIGKGGLHLGQRARQGGGAALVLGADQLAAARERLPRRLGQARRGSGWRR